jgi:predicted RNase H-like HicB family nuclease
MLINGLCIHIYGGEAHLGGHFVEERQIVIRKDDADYFIASCPSLKGCHSYGVTLEEALDNIKECIQLCQEELEEEGRN